MKLKFILISLILPLTSCEQMIDNYWDHKQEELYVSPYRGVYIGTFSGGDYGTLKMEVGEKDGITLSKTSEKFVKTEVFYGTLSGFVININNEKILFRGNLAAENGIYTGTWSQNGLSGTWSMKKQ